MRRLLFHREKERKEGKETHQQDSRPRNSHAHYNIPLLVALLTLIACALYILWERQFEEALKSLWSASKGNTASLANQHRFDVHIFCMNAQTYYRELIDWLLSHVNDSDMFVMQSMVTTCALFWLLYRAWKTLWTPVPQLISVLGIEVPDPPTVSLAGIKADAVTLHWTRPEPHKAVFKYLIQVNGVNVGESSKTETAITVTGLKPSHFYNVRVIAVGSNNFQTGSKVIRLQTYDRYGRPNLPNGRLPSSFVPEDTQSGPVVEDNDASAGVRSHGTTIEPAVIPEGAPVMTREHSGGYSGQRRNTVGRKHSASAASSDHPPVVAQSEPPESMQELTEKFESIREEIEEVNSQTFREAEEFNVQIAELEREKTKLRQILKEKEEASEKLKKEVNYAERASRQAQNRRSQKEKELKEKQAEKAKKRDDMTKWKKDLEAMKKERELWAKETKDLRALHEKKMKELRGLLEQEQKIITRLEEEIRVRGRQIKELEIERQNLPGAQDDEEAKAQSDLDRQRDFEWEKKERDYITKINDQTLEMQQIATQTRRAQMVYGEMLARQSGSATNLMMHTGNPGAGDLETSSKHKGRQRRSRQRKSRNGTMSSPSGYYSSHDQSYSTGIYNEMNNTESPSFAPGPYFDMNSQGSGMVPLSESIGMSESEIRAMTAGAPLSPTAASLLPSNIFSDEDQLSPDEPLAPSFGNPYMYGSNFENDPQSPLSDGSRSASLVSSPHNSSLNLKRFSGNMEAFFDNERRSNSMNSPGPEYGVGSDSSSGNHAVPTRRFDFLNSFRPRGKTTVDDGLPLGSLKPGQSHSFPRQTDEPIPPGFRNRRTSFSSGWTNLGFRSRNSPAGEVTEGNGPAPARNASTARRRKGIFSSALDRDESHSAFDRDPNSPRPASIASSDLPRPSTDSARMIWGQAAEETSVNDWGSSTDVANLNRNSPLAPNWSLNVAQPWSRNPSRRPSIQYASTPSVNLTSGIVSDDDAFLPYTRHQSSPPPAGVIGGPRPKSAHKPTPPPITPKLNPAAPTFKTIFTRSSKPEKDKGKMKTKEKDAEVNDTRDDISPTTSRKSRDGRSIRTQDSHAESHDSFASGLERETSNTTSEINAPSAASTKDKGENSFQKLLRKGSSSKFSFSGKGTLWGAVNKKAGSGASDYDENDLSASLSKSYEGNGGKDSVTSSPTIGGGGFGGAPRRSINLGNWGSRMLSKGKKETSETESGLSTEEVEDGDI